MIQYTQAYVWHRHAYVYTSHLVCVYVSVCRPECVSVRVCVRECVLACGCACVRVRVCVHMCLGVVNAYVRVFMSKFVQQNRK